MSCPDQNSGPHWSLAPDVAVIQTSTAQSHARGRSVVVVIGWVVGSVVGGSVVGGSVFGGSVVGNFVVGDSVAGDTVLWSSVVDGSIVGDSVSGSAVVVNGNVLHSLIEKQRHGFAVLLCLAIDAFSKCSWQWIFCFCGPSSEWKIDNIRWSLNAWY